MLDQAQGPRVTHPRNRSWPRLHLTWPGGCHAHAASPPQGSAISYLPFSLEKRGWGVGRVLNPYTSDFWDFYFLKLQ